MKKAAFAFPVLFFSAAFFSCSTKEPSRTAILMNTVCSVNAFDEGTKQLHDEIFVRLLQIEKTFSATLPGSELSRINACAGIAPAEASSDFLTVLKTALTAEAISGNAFTPAAGPLIDAWGINTEHEAVPTEKEIEDALSLTDSGDIEISGNYVFLKKSGMKLHLGGIAKGFAADEVCKILRNRGIQRAVIDLGGNIYVWGKKPGGAPWSVGIKDPGNPSGKPLLKLSTGQASVVTSGAYERYFESGGKRYHHIFDMKTGFPAESGAASVTVICQSSMTADALSTCFFVLGIEKSFSLLEKCKEEFKTDISAVFISSSGQVFATSNLTDSLSFASEDSRSILFF